MTLKTKKTLKKAQVSCNKRFIRFRRYVPRLTKDSAQKQNLPVRDIDRAPHNTNQYLLETNFDSEDISWEKGVSPNTFGSMIGNPTILNSGIFRIRSKCSTSTSSGMKKNFNSNVLIRKTVDCQGKLDDLVQNLSINEDSDHQLKNIISASTADEDWNEDFKDNGQI